MQLIDSIRVVDLFGLYTYTLPQEGRLSEASILYGDNGLGKSTILRLAFHLLSAAEDRGHRTALTKVPFQQLEVRLASGAQLHAIRGGAVDQGTLELVVLSPSGEREAEWIFTPRSGATVEALGEGMLLEIGSDGRPRIFKTKSAGKKSSTPSGEKAYLAALAKYVPVVFILNADRRLDSDRVSDPSDELELRKVMRFDEPKRINDLVVRSREIGLTQALGAAAKWVNKKALIGANQGSMNVHSVYANVLRHLMIPGVNAEVKSDVSALMKQLSAIEARSAEFAKYEFTARVSVSEFRKSLSGKGVKKRELAANLLKPYVDSLEGRLNALSEVYSVLDKFITVVNSFLSDKSLIFKLTNGFSIENRLGNKLNPAQLSSGEQQLLLLFCYVLISRDNPSVFMIDEPEISLNVKWQRQLVQSLLEITEGASIQFILASHSLELLTQHRKRVVKLAENK